MERTLIYHQRPCSLFFFIISCIFPVDLLSNGPDWPQAHGEIAPSLIWQIIYSKAILGKFARLSPIGPGQRFDGAISGECVIHGKQLRQGWGEWINLTPLVTDRATSLRVCDRSPKHAKEWSQSGAPEFIPKNETPQPRGSLQHSLFTGVAWNLTWMAEN